MWALCIGYGLALAAVDVDLLKVAGCEGPIDVTQRHQHLTHNRRLRAAGQAGGGAGAGRRGDQQGPEGLEMGSCEWGDDTAGAWATPCGSLKPGRLQAYVAGLVTVRVS